MLAKLSLLKNRALSFLPSETGAVAFEYPLIMGGVSAVIMIALAVTQPTLATIVVDGACSAINGVYGGTMDCTP